MIGYLLLSVALLCGVIKGYCGKRSGGAITLASDALAVNVVRMCACMLIGLFAVAIGGGMRTLAVSSQTLAITALSGISTAVFVVTWLLSVRTGAYMLVDVFLLLGVILPLLLCSGLYGERISPLQWVGIAILAVAGYIMCTYNAKLKGKMSLRALLLLILCALSYGVTDFSQKMFIYETTGVGVAVFNLYTYLFAGVTLVVCYPLFRLREHTDAPRQSFFAIVKPIIGYVSVMALCLFLNSYFKTEAAKHLTASQIYPLSQGGSLILSMLMSHFLFRERINARAIVGIALSGVALIMINLF